MKGQITKHEWVKPNDYREGIPIPEWIKVCPFCKTRRINAAEGGYLYKVHGDHIQILSEEPTCVTRKIQADGTDSV